MVSLAASWLWPRILSSLRIRTCPTRTLPLSMNTFGIVQAIWLYRAVIWLITLVAESGGLTWRNGSLTPDTSCSGE